MADRPLATVLERLQNLHPRKIDLSLGRIVRLLDALGRPHERAPPALHIAGTNGKGSTAAFLRAILEASGARVHVYTSPHLVRFNERFRVQGRFADDEALIEALETCERANAGAPITFFEITTAAAFLLFSQSPAEWLVLETGLGGRVDATNVLAHPAATLITSISLDHVEFLGASLPAIAFEKAGIFKSGHLAFCAPQRPEAQEILISEAARKGVELALAGRDYFFRPQGSRFILEDARGALDLPAPGLAGDHQYENAALAVACLRKIAPTLDARVFARGLVCVEWPARLQRFARGALVERCPPGAELWLDGGHNRDGALKLAAAMQKGVAGDQRPLILICAFLATKDLSGFLQAFAAQAHRVIGVPLPGGHAACPPEDVVSTAQKLGLAASTALNIEGALSQLRTQSWAVAPRIVICGSLHLAGAALEANGHDLR